MYNLLYILQDLLSERHTMLDFVKGLYKSVYIYGAICSRL